MDVIKKLNALRLERNMSVYRLSELSVINQSTLANTFSRGTVPSVENLEKMCDALGITLAQFFMTDEKIVCLTDDEEELITHYRKLSEQMRKSIFDLLLNMAGEHILR